MSVETAWWRRLRADGTGIAYKKRMSGETEEDARRIFGAASDDIVRGMTEAERRELHRAEREAESEGRISPGSETGSSPDYQALRAATFRQIHEQPTSRLYSVAEVKQIVYPLLDLLDRLTASPDTRRETDRG